MERKLRVILIAPDIPDYCIAFAEAVATRADVTLIAPAKFFSGQPARLPESLPVHRVAWPRHRSFRSIGFIIKLVRFIRAYNPDIIHVLSEKNVWLNLALALLQRFPIVTTVHDVQYHPGDIMSQRVPLWCTHLTIKQSHAIIVHGDSLKLEAAQRLPVDPSKIYVVPHLALPYYLQIATRKNLAKQRTTEQINILFYGRVQKYKGIDIFVDAAKQVAKSIPHLRFTIAGRAEADVRHSITDLDPALFDVRDRFIDDDETAQVFLNADLTVLPYLEASSSGVLAIALTFGIPAVVTDCGELGTTVREYGAGVVVPAAESAIVADAILSLVQDSERRRALGRRAQSAAHTSLSDKTIGAEACAIYRRVIESSAKNPAEG
jgi:glycosyltransferase involved in cell wall biosynthesis